MISSREVSQGVCTCHTYTYTYACISNIIGCIKLLNASIVHAYFQLQTVISGY